MNNIENILDIIGVIAFAISGVTKGARHHLDILGVIVLGVITALGGGVIRDVLLNQFPFSIENPRDAYIAIITSVVTFLIVREDGPFFIVQTGIDKGLRKISGRMSLNYIIQIFDALGLAVFTIIGASKAYEMGMGPLPVVLMATLTGVGGGIIRDVLVREIPFVLKDEIYASLCIVGAFFYYISLHFNLLSYAVVDYIVVIGIFVARLLAVKYQFSLPSAKPEDDKSGSKNKNDDGVK